MSKYQKGKGKYAYGFTDEDIFESEEEKNKVFAMPEVEREIFISERIDKLCRLKERDEILKKKLDTGDKYKKKEQSKDILSESNSEDGQVSKSDDDWSEDSHVKRNRSISSSDYESSLSNSDEEKEKDALCFAKKYVSAETRLFLNFLILKHYITCIFPVNSFSK